MGLDVGGAAAGAEAGGGVLGEEAGDEVARVGVGGTARAGAGGEGERAADDVAERRLVGSAGERRTAVDELVEEHPVRPPVHGRAMRAAARHLGGHVLVRPHERARPRIHRLRHEPRTRRRHGVPPPLEPEEVVRDAGRVTAGLVVGVGGAVERRRGGGLQREVEVGEHDVAVGADEDVLGLEVAVDDAHHVEVLDGEEHLGGVEAGGGEREAAGRHAVAEGVEVAAGAELHDGAGEVRRGVEVGEEGGEEGVVQLPQDPLLRRRAPQLLLPRHRPPVHHLHRVHARALPLRRAPEAAQVHRPDVAAADAPHELEVPRA